MQVSFKASSINTFNIIKCNPSNKKEESFTSSFVELDTQNDADYKALRTVARTWENGGSLANDLFDNFAVDRHRARALFPTPLKNIKFRYFALLAQDKISTEIDSDSILGVASFIEETDGSYTIQQVQTHPKHVRGASDRGFRNIGKALILSILSMLENKKVQLYPVNNGAKNFYKKLKFESIPCSYNMRFKI